MEISSQDKQTQIWQLRYIYKIHIFSTIKQDEEEWNEAIIFIEAVNCDFDELSKMNSHHNELRLHLSTKNPRFQAFVTKWVYGQSICRSVNYIELSEINDGYDNPVRFLLRVSN